ncbi:MAG TPA: DUF3040 domain-containing protein [Pseudonocardiaceae bacterium]|nr:DUF3040 domain-containing protein [Pseudonocardiaceae bacterium]
MTLSAHERRVLAEIERDLAADQAVHQSDRRVGGRPVPLLLAAGWLASVALFVALLIGSWLPVVIAAGLGVLWWACHVTGLLPRRWRRCPRRAVRWPR